MKNLKRNGFINRWTNCNKNKLEKPEGYIYFDKEEYDSDQELIKRYNEIVGLKTNY